MELYIIKIRHPTKARLLKEGLEQGVREYPKLLKRHMERYAGRSDDFSAAKEGVWICLFGDIAQSYGIESIPFGTTRVRIKSYGGKIEDVSLEVPEVKVELYAEPVPESRPLTEAVQRREHPTALQTEPHQVNGPPQEVGGVLLRAFELFYRLAPRRFSAVGVRHGNRQR